MAWVSMSRFGTYPLSLPSNGGAVSHNLCQTSNPVGRSA
nr:MAG TPA: hypothetical protein [Caudoviricetes sp.]